MRRLLAATLMLGLLLPGIATADGLAGVDPARNLGQPSFLGYAPDRFIVILKDDVLVDHGRDARSPLALSSLAGFDELARKYEVDQLRPQFPGADQRGAADLARHYKVHLGAESLDAAMAEYAALPNVERVEKVGIHAMYATPNDGYYDPYQWHLNASGDHDIDAPEAWDLETGSTSIIVAILDSGTRYYHPDLGGVNATVSNPGASRGNMWINSAELNGSSGVDDDGNGYTDDWIGYDFIDGVSNCWAGEDCTTKDNDPRDFNGHGTHTSGIFGMLTNDGYGMCGVAGGWGSGSQTEYGNGVKIMACRMGYSYNYFNQEYGVVMMDAAAEAFYYAANNGAKIASCSWGSSNSGGIGTAATYFINNGGIICVAAGNDGSQTADYLNGRGDCISVAATDQNDNAASFTTYGTWVDISAPGVGIYSTYHDHTDPNTTYWAALDGTSMATPMVAGVVALIWSHNPTWTAAQVETQLYGSADNIDAYLSSTYIGKMGAGRINAYNAVNTGPPPAPVAAFVGSPTSGTAPLTVSFTDQSTGSITSWAWTFGDGGTSTAQSPSHQYNSAGTYTVSLTVTGPGGSDDETKTDYITVSPCVAPVAGFSGSPTTGAAPLMVSFSDLSTGNPDTWNWDFGDGVGTSTAQNPNYTYATPGLYTVTLTASNACGSDGVTEIDYIDVQEPQPAQEAFALSDIPVLGTYSGTYASTHVSDNAYEIITEALSTSHPRKITSQAEHKWNFTIPSGSGVMFYLEAYRPANGDGDDFIFEYSTDDAVYSPLVTVASGTEQVYSVALPNLDGTVYVKVRDSNRSWDMTSLDAVYIDQMYFDYSSAPAPPVADFSGTPTAGAAPLAVAFTDLSAGSPTSWAWDFGDGVGTSTAQNPNYSYAVNGTYTVSLTATNAYGSDSEVKTGYITVADQSTSMHVENMVVVRSKVGPNYVGTCTVTIVDANSLAVAGATVYVTATGPTGGDYNGVTGSTGTVTFQTAGIKKPSGEWCFEVTNVTHASYTYDSGSNAVTSACESGWLYGSGGPSLVLDDQLPTDFALYQNRPNPFNPTTDVSFDLPEAAQVRIDVFNVLGHRVTTLFDGHAEAGQTIVTWDASAYSSGVYFYRLTTGSIVETKKMVLLK